MYHVWGASCMLPHQPLKIFHLHRYLPFGHCLTPSCTRIRRVEKALPPSSASPKVIAPNSGSCQTCILKSWRNQGEHQHQATHLSSLEIQILLDSLAWPRILMWEKSNPWALMCTNKGEHYRLWALHQPWPKEPPASDLLVRLRQPPPLSPRHWHPGHKTRQGTDMKLTRHHKGAPTRAKASAMHYHEGTQMRVP